MDEAGSCDHGFANWHKCHVCSLEAMTGVLQQRLDTIYSLSARVAELESALALKGTRVGEKEMAARIAELEAYEKAAREVDPIIPCTDGNCLLKIDEDRRGMHTNGGCHCFMHGPRKYGRKLERAIRRVIQAERVKVDEAVERAAKCRAKSDEYRIALAELEKDRERLQAIEDQFMGYALIHDDHSRFTVCGTGTQNLEDKDGNSVYDKPIAIQSTYFIEEDEWSPSAREAIDEFIRMERVREDTARAAEGEGEGG